MVWLLLLLALVAHEGSHALALRAFRVRFSLRIWYSRSFPWFGLGWRYYIDDLSPAQRRTILTVGPLVEASVWALGAVFIPTFSVELLLLAALTLTLNRLIPGGDLWKVHRLPKAVPAPRVP